MSKCASFQVLFEACSRLANDQHDEEDEETHIIHQGLFSFTGSVKMFMSDQMGINTTSRICFPNITKLFHFKFPNPINSPKY